MYGYIYITTNLINGKKYIGKKSSSIYVKEYLGSGRVLQTAIKKYGKENFTNEVIEWCESEDSLNEQEIYWISYYDAVKSNMFYNVHTGGKGGNTLAGFTQEQRDAFCKKVKANRPDMRGDKNPNYGHRLSEDARKRIGEANSKHLAERNRTRNYKHSEETKRKISETCKLKREVFAKHRVGTICVKNETLGINHYIKPSELEYYQSLGYVKGEIKRLPPHNKGNVGKRKHMNNGVVSKCVKLEDVDKYLNNGFVFGRLISSTTIESIDGEKDLIE